MNSISSLRLSALWLDRWPDRSGFADICSEGWTAKVIGVLPTDEGRRSMPMDLVNSV